ncbi:MAG: family 20 glycosylhydrolase [Candidatus Eisenbacteria bacterium]|uniref:beta-N-acetylhexosaminidase n=1 Tax=Eiseniibacteriota bacterium TaxID=2212470 RepID=A0A948RUH4_UNCEI|nr:family 20 glycosylhydrolase [Candidatus Eisenbacteria bacterium]MBU1948125.1 family 20 glycosylhydrolase [Candidatus Eisenbacteria bacterium]MBU2689788.1 family 20 glycosylhydrolase [Candidatus Eisenbacteria bacterium]
MSLDLLHPRPQQIRDLGSHWTIPRRVPIVPPLAGAVDGTADALDATVAGGGAPCDLPLRRLSDGLKGQGIEPSLTPSSERLEGGIRLQIDRSLFSKPQSYEMALIPTGLEITAADDAGLFYGILTFCQLLQLYPSSGAALTLPTLFIRDEPDFIHRGVMLDVSRDRIPTMPTLYELVDLLAGWKINQLQLYMEHTFAYRGHAVVWKDADPFTPEEIQALDRYCRERYIELVPNQNSFGHLHHWLIHAPYRSLAECPDGVEHPFSPSREPFSLCPIDPRSISFLRDLYDQLLPNFTSRQFNVGLDETFDLGMGRSAEVCQREGRGRVYLEFLRKIHQLVAERSRKMQFWGDIILHYPELIGECPSDAIALEWGYEANHPFEEHLETFVQAGLEFYVCPGTSSWNSLAGRTKNALGNLSRAAVAGHAAGASGYLITDWGDHGHLQPPPVSTLGFLAGAAYSWNVSSASDPKHFDIPRLLDAHAFKDRTLAMADVVYGLGNLYRTAGSQVANGSALFYLLLFPDLPLNDNRFQGLTAASLGRTIDQIEDLFLKLSAAEIARTDAGLLISEFQWVASMLRFSCRMGLARFEHPSGGSLGAIPGAERLRLAGDLRDLLKEHQRLWRCRSRPGGLRNSSRRLERVIRLLEK